MPATLRDISQLFAKANTRPLVIEINLDDGLQHEGLFVPHRFVITIARNQNRAQLEIPQLKPYLGGNIGGTTQFKENMLLANQDTIDFEGVFEAFRNLASTAYIAAFRNALNLGGSETAYFDIRVGQHLISEWRGLKTGDVRRNREAIRQLTDDIKRLFGYASLEIDASLDGATLQAFVNGKSYDLGELGAGLAQFVIVLFNITRANPEYILIDEPELNLHPSLQLDFLTTLGTYARQGVLFATHSVGLARAAADRIYSVRKLSNQDSEVRTYEDTPRLSEFLGEMSFHGYKELGFERIVLVEGPMEVKTFQQFLRLKQAEHKIVFLTLGGGTLINANSASQLQEIKRVTDNIWAVIDSERKAAGEALPQDRAAFQAACNAAGIKCHVLEKRCIDNYLSDAAVKKIKGDKYRALGPYEVRSAVNPIWAKEENWRIAREMTAAELTGTDLWNFIDEVSADLSNASAKVS